MTPYEQQAARELRQWQQQMQRAPTYLNRFTRRVQTRLNNLLPEKVHQVLTGAIRQMVQGVLLGSRYISRRPQTEGTLEQRETAVQASLNYYRTTAAAEGAVTGAGGLLLGLADFPLLLGLKLKFLFDVAALYGFDAHDYTERLYLLHVFQLAFSSQHSRNAVYRRVADWEAYRQTLPTDPQAFDWREFQQEYRDYIDLAKLAQLVPVIGAAVGAVANYKLMEQLSATAQNCYRMRRGLVTEA